MSETILMMLTRKNTPLQHPTWKATICLECGQECWERRVPEKYKEKLRGAKRMRMDCALKAIEAQRREAANEK